MLQTRPLKQSFYFNGIKPHLVNGKSTIKRPHVSNVIGKPDILDLYLVTFTLIVDDLVFWDGSTKMGQLGGGGSQTAWGYQTVSSPNCDGGDDQIQRAAGIAAGVGPDVPLSCLEWLENIGVDISGIKQHPDAETPRAWQILEQDGRRHEIWRTRQLPQQSNLLLPPFASLPLEYQRARAFHVGIHPEHPPLQLLKDLRHALDTHSGKNGTGLLSIETFTKASTKIQPDGDLWAAVELCDIFSPNEEEARSILDLTKLNRDSNDAELIKLTSPFIKAGARWCSLRRGADGAVVHEESSKNAWHIPAVADTTVVDPTGCGNAFCGAFIAGIQSQSGAELAGMLGTAATSVMAEYQGIPQRLAIGNARDEVRRRFLKIKSRLL